MCYNSVSGVDDITTCEETDVAANVQGPMDAATEQCTPPSQEGSTVETEAGTAGENGKDVRMEGSGGDNKERIDEGMEEGSKGDGGGGDTQENDRPKQQKRKWGNREGRYCHSDFQ